MSRISIDELELRNQLTLMLTNLIQGIISSIDFNNFELHQFQNLIIYDIENECPGLTQKLINHLNNERNYSIEEITSIASKSTIKTWPASFKKDLVKLVSMNSLNHLKFKQLFNYFDETKSERKRCLEMKECCIHHCKRSFECNNTMWLYNVLRFGCGCCWTSYAWRLVCRPIQNKISDDDKCCLVCALWVLPSVCCPCYCCYYWDSLNYDKSRLLPEVQIQSAVTNQPTAFHYSRQYFDSFFYLAIEVSNQLNEKFVIWLKLPYTYHYQFDIHGEDNF